MEENKKAVVLLSGGLDSSICLYKAIEDGYVPYALCFDYGQRHVKEVECSRRIAEKAGAIFKKIKIDLRQIGGSALTDDIEVPMGRKMEEIARDIPPTYVPARNTIFLSVALSFAEVVDAETIYMGANMIDNPGYPDTTAIYIKAYQELINVAIKKTIKGGKIEIKTPLIRMTKKEIVEEAVRLKVPLELTWSCYLGEEEPCGQCDACRLRAKGFQEAGLTDSLCHKSGSDV
ncbi:7-cyano-7-deazaguanine synthase QueC [bacterium]|nr:7-cyano-7-deazaguanine synthase QueC [bacterium]NIN92403.1 7-cyano-7-deazaguanine synthase QueC [bacterium]NIO18517.1 7-cyano-7-deazaguanine synthase QueC [bacterium]NIO73513.1 7-cyano-7-deazaguanine synthase QueC [bacterium]